MQKIKIGGKYTHYKNHLVRVIGVALHTETKEELVIYEKLEEYKGYKKGQLWARPKGMFLEKVQINGKRVPRFTLLEE